MVSVTEFGKSKQYTVDNGILKVVFLNYGARIAELHYEGKNVCLGYDRFEDFEKSDVYVGCTIGRYANRIANGSFMLNGEKVQLDLNEGNSACLHGGSVGFDKKFWDGEILSDTSIRFTYRSPHNDMGFPGNMDISVIFTVEDSSLSFRYFVQCDRDTVSNVTCHAYFNLDGYNGNSCKDMLLQLNADHYLPTAPSLLPTGEISSVENTPYDFRTPRNLDGEYDNCFVLGMDRKNRKAGTLFSPTSKIAMDFETTFPALQIYSCYRLEDNAGKGGISLHPYQAVAIEPEMFPNSPNQSNFPSVILKKGEVLVNSAKFTFRVVK